MMSHGPRILSSCSCLLLATTGAFAQEDGAIFQSGDPTLEPGQPGERTSGRPDQPIGLTWAISGGDLYQFNASIDGGGSVSVNRAFVEGGFEYRFSPSLAIGFEIGAEFDSYDFKDGGTFANAAGGTPWTSTNELTLGSSVRWEIDREWSVFGAGFVRWAGEPGAQWSSAFSGGGIIAGSYTFSRKLSLGAGILASSRLDGSILLIPSLLIDWQITDDIVVTNVRGPATYPASAGIEIIYNFHEDMNVSLGFRYEYRRFRLDDSGPDIIHGGVGTDRNFPTWLRFEWRPVPKLRLHLLGGMSFGEQLELQTANGTQIQKQDVKPAPFIALFFGFKF